MIPWNIMIEFQFRTQLRSIYSIVGRSNSELSTLCELPLKVSESSRGKIVCSFKKHPPFLDLYRVRKQHPCSSMQPCSPPVTGTNKFVAGSLDDNSRTNRRFIQDLMKDQQYKGHIAQQHVQQRNENNYTSVRGMNKVAFYESIRALHTESFHGDKGSHEKARQTNNAYATFRLNDSLSENKTTVVISCCYYVLIEVIMVYCTFVAFRWWRFMSTALAVATFLCVIWQGMSICLMFTQFTWKSIQGANLLYLNFAYNFFCAYSSVSFGLFFLARALNVVEDDDCPILLCDPKSSETIRFQAIIIIGILVLLINQSLYAPYVKVSIFAWCITFACQVGGVIAYNRIHNVVNPLAVGVAIVLIQFGCVMIIIEGQRYDRFLLTRLCESSRTNFDNLFSIVTSEIDDPDINFNSHEIDINDEEISINMYSNLDAKEDSASIGDDISSVTWGERGIVDKEVDNKSDASILSDFDKYCMNKSTLSPDRVRHYS